MQRGLPGDEPGGVQAHVTALYYSHPWNLETSAHEASQEEDSGSRAVCSQGIIFFPSDIACVMLDPGADGLDASVAEVVYYSFGSFFSFLFPIQRPLS